MYLFFYKGMLLFHELCHNRALLEIDPQCFDPRQEA